LKFIVSPYTLIWQTLFQIGNELLSSIVGYPNAPLPITNPFIYNHRPTGSVLTNHQTYPTYNYLDPYVNAINYGLQLLQSFYL
jgi:hypothetical protein